MTPLEVGGAWRAHQTVLDARPPMDGAPGTRRCDGVYRVDEFVGRTAVVVCDSCGDELGVRRDAESRPQHQEAAPVTGDGKAEEWGF